MNRQISVWIVILSCILFAVPQILAERGEGRKRVRPTATPRVTQPSVAPSPTFVPTHIPVPTTEVIVYTSPTQPAPSPRIHEESQATPEIVMLDGVDPIDTPWFWFFRPRMRWWFVTPLTYVLGVMFEWA